MDAREIGRTDHSRVVHQFGDDELRLGVVAARRKMREIRLPNGVKQPVSGNRDSPTKNEHFGVKNGTQARARLTQPGSELTKRMQGARIFVDQQLREDVARQPTRAFPLDRQLKPNAPRIRDFIGHAKQGTTRAVLLDTATRTASARQPVGYNPQMTELARRTETAPQESVSRHDRSPDARADRQHRHIADVACCTKAKLSPACRVGVVVDGDVKVETLAQAVTEWLIAPVDVGRVVHGRLCGIDEASRGHSGSNDLLPIAQLLDHAHHEVGDGVRITRGCGFAEFGNDLSVIAHQGSGDLGSADVDSDGVHERRV